MVGNKKLKETIVNNVKALIMFKDTHSASLVNLETDNVWENLKLRQTLNLENASQLLLKVLLTVGHSYIVVLVLKKLNRNILNRRNISTQVEDRKEQLKSEGKSGKTTGDQSKVESSESSKVQGSEDKPAKKNFFQEYSVLSSKQVDLVSPADFIGKYLDFMADETGKLLNDSLGKVLFVDEVYGLMSRCDNMYGHKALNEITSFMDAHEGEIVLVFFRL